MAQIDTDNKPIPKPALSAAAPVKRFHGVVVPVVTPLEPDGQLDEPAAIRIIDHVLAGVLIHEHRCASQKSSVAGSQPSHGHA